MDELENDALSLLLVLDDNLFPQFLEWASASGWADLVLFVLEADTLRFRINDEFVLPKDKISFQQSFHLIWKNNNGCFNRIIPRDKVESLKRLTESHVPFNAVFSQICDLVWSEMIKRGRHIANSSMWPSIRRCIVDHSPLTMNEVLDDMTYRKYFERFLQENPSDLACLQCWISTRRILTQVEKFVRSVAAIAAAATEDESKTSFMKRWRTSSTAVKSANKALQVGSGSISSVNNANSNSSAGPHDGHSPSPPQDKEFSDPFEAFRVLLDGTRSLQKQFFPSAHTGNSSTAGTYVNILSSASANNRQGSDQRMSGYLRDRADSPQSDDGSNSSYSAVTLTTSSTGGGGKPSSRNCAGLSESLRMELAATLSLNSSVRTRNIETVDQAFAFACANTLDRLLRALDRETLSYLTKAYHAFEASTDYATMVAAKRASHAPQIAAYIERLEFLNDRVRHEKHVPWTDPQSAGKMYVFYEQAGGAETDDDGEESSDADSTASGEDTAYAETNKDRDRDPSKMRSVLAAKISGLHSMTPPDGHSLRKDSRFNTSSSGWQFSNAESFIIRNKKVDSAAEEKHEQQQTAVSSAFNPDIVAVGLEFYVPEVESISPLNIAAVTTNMRVWVGGSNYRPKATKEPVQAGGSGKSRAPPNTPIDRRKEVPSVEEVSASRRAAAGLSIHMEDCEEDCEEEEGEEEEGESDGEDEDDDVIAETTTDGGDIDYEALLQKTPSKRGSSISLAPLAVATTARDTLKKKTSFRRRKKKGEHGGNQLDLLALDLEALDKNFNRHLYQSGAVHSTAPSHLSLQQLVSSLVLGLAGAHDTSCAGDPDRFDFQREENFSFVVDSRGLQNLNNLIFANKVAKQSVSEFKASFTGLASGGRRVDRTKPHLERPYNNVSTTADGSVLYNVSVCVKTTTVGPSELALAHKRLHHAEYSVGGGINKPTTPGHVPRACGGASISSPFSGVGVACTSLFNINEEESSDGGNSSGADNSRLSAATLRNRAEQRLSLRSGVSSSLPRYRTKVNVGLAYSPVNPRHSMITLLKNISLQVFYQSLLHPASASTKANSNPSSPRSGPGSSSLKKTNSLVSGDLVALNQNSSMRNLLCTDNYVTGLASTAGSLLDVNDSDRAMRLISRLDRSVQAGLGVETLYDLYMGAAYLQSATQFSTGSGDSSSAEEKRKDEEVETEYCYPIMKHLGICDFSLCSLLGAISARLLLQVLMLLLTDRSVVLLSSNVTLLTKLQAAIPRLIWPFRLHNTHNLVQLQSHAALDRFLTRNDQTVSPSGSQQDSSTQQLRQQQEQSHQHTSSSNSSTFQRMMGRINSSNRSMTNVRDALLPEGEDGRKRSQTDLDSHSPPTPPTPPTPPPTPAKRREGDDSRALLLCVDSKVLGAASPENKARLLNLSVKGWVVTCFDIDSGTLVTTHHSSSSSLPTSSSLAGLAASPLRDPFDEDDLDVILAASDAHLLEAVPELSRLGNEGLFRCANFDVFRELFAHVAECIDDYSQEVFAQSMHFNGAAFAQLTKATNGRLERAFYLFWTELVLRALPRNINYYHSSKVLSCDIKCMTAELLSNTRSSMACGEDEFRSGRAALDDAVSAEQMHFLTAEEFRVYFAEQTNSAPNCLLHVFYQDLLLDGSPVFLDLLRRHCKVLEYWAF